MRPRFGVLVLQNSSVDDLIERVRAVEGWGFDHAWVADHFLNYHRPDEDWHEGWTLLAALARETSTIRLGTLVSSMALRNPAILARQAMTVDHLSNGRLELGIGSSGTPTDFAMTGVGPWNAAERRERFGEFVEIVDRLLRGESVSFAGRHYSIEGASVRPRPIQTPRPSLTLGALGKGAMRVAVERAESWSSYPVKASGRVADTSARVRGNDALALAHERNATVDRLCEEVGRDPASLRRSYLSLIGYTEPVPEPDEFCDIIERYADAGMDEFIVYWPSDKSDRERLEAIAKGCRSVASFIRGRQVPVLSPIALRSASVRRKRGLVRIFLEEPHLHDPSVVDAIDGDLLPFAVVPTGTARESQDRGS